jgi:putative alpha-1,2-mannosidase
MPHDNAGLVKLLGGDSGLVDKIDQVFDAKVDAAVYAHMEDISGLIGHYAHGNEPSHHVAYLYNYAGAPWKTQARLAQIVPASTATRRTAWPATTTWARCRPGSRSPRWASIPWRRAATST